MQPSTSIANTSVTTSRVATPIVVKQLTQPKSFNGTTSWKTYKEYYERVCAVNGWSTQQEKAQNLMLALEGSAAEILKDVEDTSPTVYTDIWTQLARRFGMTDGPREAMRRFDNRRQQDSETVQEFEQSLRVLHRDAWPTATAAQRDSALKRRFEDGLTNPEMTQFLRLHARNDDFPNTVLKARQFADASDTGRHRKSVRFLAPASNIQGDDNVETLLDGFRGIMNEYLSNSDTIPRINNISTSSSTRFQSPARQGFQSPRAQSPASQSQGTSSYDCEAEIGRAHV